MKFCPYCGGKIVSQEARFCMNCGKSLENFQNQSVPAPARNDDFFSEASANPEGDDFFRELDNAIEQEHTAEKPIIDESKKYFLRGEFQKVERLLADIVNKGNDYANYMMAVIYEYGGDGIEVDKSKAMDFLLGNGGRGDLCGMHLFNFFLQSEHPNHDKINKLISEHLSDIENSDDLFMKFEAGFYFGNKRNDLKKSLNYMGFAERQGYWIASFWIGFLYTNGVLGQENFQKACEYYIRAANKGIAIAAKNMGIIYKYAPEGVTQDLRLAKKYLLIAAKQNEAEAIHELAGVYISEGDFREAIRWLEKNVSTNGYAESAAELGVMLLNIGDNPKIQTDFQRAYQFCQFALSKDENNPTALFGIGFSYIIGQAVTGDEQTARYYLNRAVEKGPNTAGGLLAQQTIESLNQNQQKQNGGCFITTAVCNELGKPDDCFELSTFRKFRDTWLVTQPDGKALIAEYYSVAPAIVDRINHLINAKEIYKTIWQKYLSPCLKFIERGDNLSCKQKYIEMVRALKRRYFYE